MSYSGSDEDFRDVETQQARAGKRANGRRQREIVKWLNEDLHPPIQMLIEGFTRIQHGNEANFSLVKKCTVVIFLLLGKMGSFLGSLLV